MKRILWMSAAILCIVTDGALASGRDYPGAPRYDITVKVMPADQRLEVAGTLSFPAAQSDRMSVDVLLSQSMPELTAVITAPAAIAGEAKLEKLPRPSNEATWRITPRRPIPAGQRLTIQFTAVGGAKRAPQFEINPAVSIATGYGTNWYPEVEGDDRGTGLVRYDVPASLKLIATGVATGSQTSGERAVHTYRLDRPTTLCFALGGYHTVRREGKIPVELYLLRERPGMQRYLEGCADIAEQLTSTFGSYPFGGFALVEVPADQAARAGFLGASVEGFIYVSSAMLDRPFAPWYFGHEIAHQWWGVGMRISGQGEFLLSEGIAHWAALVTTESLEGRRAAEKARRGAGEGGAIGYLKMAAAGLDEPLNKTRSNNLCWTKGFLALDMLSREIGRERFRHALADVARQRAYGLVRWEDFRLAIDRAAGRDMSWFFAEWLESTGVPDLRLEWRQEGRTLRGKVLQSSQPKRATVEIEVEGPEERRIVRRITVEGAETAFTWNIPFRATTVTLDPAYKVLRWTPEYRGIAEAFAPAQRAVDAIQKRDFDRAREILRNVRASAPQPDLFGARSVAEYFLGRIDLMQDRPTDAMEHFNAALREPVREVASVPWVYRYLAEAAQKAGDEKTLRWAVAAAVAADAQEGASTGAGQEAKSLLPPSSSPENTPRRQQ